MINFQIKNKIRFPSGFLFQKDLEHVASRIFIPVLKNNIDKEVDLQENAYPPLAESTIKIKRAKGLSKKILTATSLLRNSFFHKPVGDKKVVVSIRSERKNIGNILQNQGVGKSRRKFNFFGISTRMEVEAIKYMKNKIKETIRNARKRA